MMRPQSRLEPNDLFIGFNSDTTSTLVLHLTGTVIESLFDPENCLIQAKKYLLRCATPDCVLRTTARTTMTNSERQNIWNEYFVNQSHLTLDHLILYHMKNCNTTDSVGRQNQLLQITTHSKSTLLSLNLTELKVEKKFLLRIFFWSK